MKKIERTPTKIDSKKNGDASKGAKRLEKEKDYIPLHIKKGLTILVPKEKCNEEYRQAYLRKINSVTESSLVGTAAKRYELVERLTYEKLHETKDLSLCKAAKILGVAKETVSRYRKEVLNGC